MTLRGWKTLGAGKTQAKKVRVVPAMKNGRGGYLASGKKGPVEKGMKRARDFQERGGRGMV